MSYVVFLDIDGVLNSKTTCEKTPSEQYVGIDEIRVAVLSNTMKENDVDGVVLTTTWKNMPEDSADYIYLISHLNKYEISVLGKTKETWSYQREEGILNYLETHPEIEEFVILDDQPFGFRKHTRLWERFIDTQGKGIEYGTFASHTPSISTMLFLDSIKNHRAM